MVTLTRITGKKFALNPDLVERVDCTPDTVITLVDGTKYLVRESLDEVVRAILDYRAAVLATASAFERVGDNGARRGRLVAVPEDHEDPGATARDDLPVQVLPLTPRTL